MNGLCDALSGLQILIHRVDLKAGLGCTINGFVGQLTVQVSASLPSLSFLHLKFDLLCPGNRYYDLCHYLRDCLHNYSAKTSTSTMVSACSPFDIGNHLDPSIYNQ